MSFGNGDPFNLPEMEPPSGRLRPFKRWQVVVSLVPLIVVLIVVAVLWFR